MTCRPFIGLWLARCSGAVAAAVLSLCGVAMRASGTPGSAEDSGMADAQACANGRTEPINLSAAETNWLARHPVVTVAFDPDWTPIEYFDAQNQPAGVSVEYLRYLERALNIRFEFLRDISWQQAVAGLRDGSIDMASAVQKTEQRKQFLQFTSPYMSLPTAIFTRREVDYADISDLKAKPVAAIQGFAVYDYLVSKHPELTLVPVKSIKAGLELVHQGKAFAFLEVFAIGSRGIKDFGLFDLHAAGTISFRYEVSMGAALQNPELASILQKGLTSVPETRRVQFYQRWFAVPFIHRTDYSIMWWALAGAAAIILLVLFWNRRLEQRVAQRTSELAQEKAKLENRVAERTEELRKAHDALELRARKFRALAAELAQTENRERQRIAQVLHDHPQQLLAAARFNMASILDRLRDPDAKQAAARVVDILEQSTQALRSLTMELSPPILHDAGLVAGMHWLARWMAEKYQLTVTVSGADLPVRLPEDLRILLFHAVRELLFNVVKHAGVKEARVVVESSGEGVRITVADEGNGFDTAREPTGLPRTFGLFSIQERLALIDGQLDIVSSPGRGTKVVLNVPLAGRSTAPVERTGLTGAEPVAACVTGNAGGRGHIRVLVADDHAVMRQGLVQLLKREPDLDIVGEAVDGQDAVEKAMTLRPDVILMDVSMPRLNGLEATRCLVPALPGIRIVGLSLHERDEMMARMLAAGAKSYLVKSCPIEEIVAAIREV